MRTAARALVVFLVGASACGDDLTSGSDSGPPEDDGGPACAGREPSAEPMGNNSAVLTGPAMGTGQDPVDALRVPIEVELTAPAVLEVGRAWATRNFSSNGSVWIAIEVTNPTGELYCRITTESYRWLDEAGEPIPAREQIWLTGSVGLDDPLDAITCLAPGETGYLLDISPEGVDPWGDLRTVELELGYTAEGAGLPGLAMLPTAYTADAFGRLDVEIENTGTDTARFENPDLLFGELVLLDAEGAPLDFAVLGAEITPADGVIMPGETALIEGAHFYGGCAASLRVFLSFSP